MTKEEAQKEFDELQKQLTERQQRVWTSDPQCCLLHGQLITLDKVINAEPALKIAEKEANE